MKSLRFVLGLSVVLTACHGSTPHGSEPVVRPAEPPMVEVVSAREAPVMGVVSGTGSAIATQAADLAAPPGAVAQTLYVQPGDAVSAGDPIVRYRHEAVRLGYAQADAAATAAEAQAAHAEAELERLIPLGERGTISSSQVDSLRAQATAARAQAIAARSAARAASGSASDLVVRAPFDGVVVAVHANVGETATPGRPAARVVNPRELELTVSVHERDLPQIVAGGDVIATFPNLDRQLSGVISWVGIEIDPATRSTEVVAHLDNSAGTVPSGAFAEVLFTSDVARRAVVLPRTAVEDGVDGTFVWAVRDQQATRVPVTTRALDTERIEVVDGLGTSAVVVANHLGQLEEGPVRIADGGAR